MLGGEEKTCRVREREKRNKKNQNFYFRSMEFCRSKFIGPKMKVYLLDEGYMWVLETHDFTKDSSEEFGKSKVSGLGSIHGTS